jgi:hypothetical protein
VTDFDGLAFFLTTLVSPTAKLQGLRLLAQAPGRYGLIIPESCRCAVAPNIGHDVALRFQLGDDNAQGALPAIDDEGFPTLQIGLQQAR